MFKYLLCHALFHYLLMCLGGKNVRRSLFSRSKSMVSITHLSTAADSNTVTNSVNSSQGTRVTAPVTVVMKCLQGHHIAA